MVYRYASKYKHKDSKTIIVTENFTRIDNDEPEAMLCLGMT